MKTFIRVLLGLLIFFLIIVIIGLFLPSKIHVQRSLTIHAPQKPLFDQVNNLHNWEYWSPWHRIDSAMKIEYSGEISGTGAVYTWQSENKNVGNGKLTIIGSYPYDSILTEMVLRKQGKSTASYKFNQTDTGVLVTWGFDTDMGKNPFKKYFGLMMNKFVGSDFEKGLKNLDSVAGILSPYLVEVKDLKKFSYVSIQQKCNWDKVSRVMAESYDKLMKYIQPAGAEMTGPPYAIYHNMSDEVMDLEMGIPVNKELPAKGVIRSGTYNASKVATVDYFGFYDKLGEAHGVIQDWVIKMGLETNGTPMEQYVTDPSTEPDTAKWLTRILYPVKM